MMLGNAWRTSLGLTDKDHDHAECSMLHWDEKGEKHDRVNGYRR